MKTFKCQTTRSDEPQSNDLLLIGSIGFPSGWTDGRSFDVADFKNMISNADPTKPLNIRINSPGGDVFAAIACKGMLEAFPQTVNITISGLAASAATLITSTKNAKVTMQRGSLLMIHNPLTLAEGNQNDLRKTADELEKCAHEICSIYQTKTGLDAQKLQEMMNEETWLTCDEALELKFIDAIDDSKQVKASLNQNFLVVDGLQFSRSIFNKLPYINEDISMQIENKSGGDEVKTPIADTSPLKITNIQELVNKFPDLAKEIFNSGVKKERERIQALDKFQDVAPTEVLNDAKYVSALTVEQCAVKILEAQRAEKAQALAAIKQDGEKTAQELAPIENASKALVSGQSNESWFNMLTKAVSSEKGA